MADNSKQIIGAQIVVDTSKANPGVKELKKNLADTKAEIKSTGTAAAGASKDLGGMGGSFSNIKSQLGSLPGPLGQAASGVGGLTTAFRALLANPIGIVLAAIVGALTLLYKAFTATNEGADKMEQIFSGLRAVGEVVLNTILKLAGAIGKLFSGDFSGAFDDAKAAVTGFGDAAVNAFNAAADAARRMQEVEDTMRQLGVSRAKLNRDLAQTKEIISDENASLAEKKKAIEEVRKAEGAQTTQELENARKKLQALQDSNRAGDGDVSDDELQAEADAQAEIYRLEEKSAADIRSLNKQSRSIEKQARAQEKEERQKAIEQQKQEEQKFREFTSRLITLQQENDLLLLKDGYEKEVQQLEFKFQNQRRALEQDFKDRKITREQFTQLEAEQEQNLQLQKQKLQDKHNEELKKKEEDFQKEIAQLSNKIKLAGITDARESERVALQIHGEERLQDAITRYKDDAVKFNQVKALIDEEQRLAQQKLDDKFKQEDAKKKFESEIETQKAIIEARNADFDAKRAAVDAETILIKQAFEDRLISEQDYNAKTKELTESRQKIAEAEGGHKKRQLEEIKATITNLMEVVGKQTVAGKALGIATALINTYQGASEAIKQKSVLPSPFDVIAKIANVAAIIATGLKTVRAITSVQVPGGGGGSTQNAPTITASAPVAPVQASTKLDEGSIAGINTGQQSIRAHVVESDQQAQARRAQRLQGASVLGGDRG
jgi:hypothetical protein